MVLIKKEQVKAPETLTFLTIYSTFFMLRGKLKHCYLHNNLFSKSGDEFSIQLFRITFLKKLS